MELVRRRSGRGLPRPAIVRITYHASAELDALIAQAASTFAAENAFGPQATPSVGEPRRDLVRIAAGARP